LTFVNSLIDDIQCSIADLGFKFCKCRKNCRFVSNKGVKFVDHIKHEIKGRVNGSYSDWTIGVTNDPDKQFLDHGNPPFWTAWEADSITVAREVEGYFLNEFPSLKSQRMKAAQYGELDNERALYIYIF
jgi:hypothetical protein